MGSKFARSRPRAFLAFAACGVLCLILTTVAEPVDSLALAQASLDAAIPRAQADPTRPLYHFHAPAQWMNDPNGPIYYRGYYHLFYQLNPFGDQWGHMHWGHARSRNLVQWQHLPIALGPSTELGEEHVFSGCAVINSRGQPMIFYTSIAQGHPAEVYAEQWAALGSKDLVTWRKHPSNPLLSEQLHANKVYDWRDPFIFRHNGTSYMVLGGNLNERKGALAVVNLYRADNELLTSWKYVGVLFTHPNPKVTNIECPNFFKLGNRWVLIVSPHGPVEYFVGDFDPVAGQFYAKETGVVDLGSNFYAPNTTADQGGRPLMWGWVNGFPTGHGWNGCLTLPRILTLSADNLLLQKPAQELKKLRTTHVRLSDVSLDARTHELSGVRGDCLEIYLELELLQAAAVQLQLRRSQDGTRFVPITFDGSELDVAGHKAPLRLSPNEKTVQLHLFLDKSMIELFVNDRACLTRVIQPEANDLGVALKAAAGTARVRSFHAWQLRSIW